VVLVGESYGGIRAGLMLRDLLAYKSAPIPDSLRSEMQAHFEATLRGDSGARHWLEETLGETNPDVTVQVKR
jgi:hypothetical protein